MNPTPQLLLFADLMLKSTVVLSLALLVSRLWRGTSAANRHLIWLAAFAVLLLAPLTHTLTPRWSWQPAQADTPPFGVAAPLPASSQALENTAPLPTTAETLALATPAAAAPAQPRASAWPAWLAARNWLLLVWFAGAALLLARLAVGTAQLWRWHRRSVPLPDARPNALCRQIAADYRLARPVELRSLASCRVPMTWGTRRPVVLLPADAANWPESRLALVLRHELGHIARRDFLARQLAQFVTALYWPNPLVWLGARALRLTQEQACDDLVLAAGTPAETYALELVAAARYLHGSRQAVPAVAMAEPSTLGRRIEGIIGEPRDRRPSTRRTAAWATAVVALALASFASAQVRGAEEAKPATPSPDPFVIRPETVIAPASAAPANVVQVMIESKFLEINEDDLKDLDLGQYGVAVPSAGSSGADPAGKAPRLTWVGRLDVRAVMRALEQKPDTELLSAPSITVLSGRQSNVTVAQEFLYPQSYDAARKPQDFTTRNVGIELESTPTVAADGHTIGLELHPSVTELEGWVEYVGESAAGGNGTVPPTDKPIDRLPATAKFPAGAFQPVFSVREAMTKVTVQDGATLVLGGFTREVQLGGAPAPEAIKTAIEKLSGLAPSPDQPLAPSAKRGGTEKRTLLVFVTVKTRLVPVVPPVDRSVRVAIEAKFVEISGSGFPLKDLNLGQYAAPRPSSANSGPDEAGDNRWIGQLDVPAVMRAIAQNPDAKLLASPSVTGFSGEPAKLTATEEMRYPKNYDEPRGTGSKAPSATGIPGAPQGFQTRNVGVELRVTPAVAADGRTIALDLNRRLTEFEGYVEYGGQGGPINRGTPGASVTGPSKAYQPVFSVREISTKVTLQDGATLVMGGLTREKITKEVPTGDSVPDAGKLVQPKDESPTKRTLLIFITARIIKEDEAAKKQPPATVSP